MRDGVWLLLGFALAGCGGTQGTTAEVKATGEFLAILGVEGDSLLEIEGSEDHVDAHDVIGRRRSIRNPDEADEIARVETGYLHSAAIWNSSILVLSSAEEVLPQVHVLGDAPQPDLTRCTDCAAFGPIGMVSNLAVSNGDAYVAEVDVDPLRIVRMHPDGAVDSLTIDRPVFSGGYVPGLAARGDQVCAATNTHVLCTDLPADAHPRMHSDGDNEGANWNVTPIAIVEGVLYQFIDDELVAGPDGETIAVFPSRPSFELFYMKNLPGETQIVADGEWLYVAARQFGLVRVPVTGGDVRTLYDGHVVNSVAVTDDAVFFTTHDEGRPATLQRMDKPQ